jgi:hypothetical protein
MGRLSTLALLFSSAVAAKDGVCVIYADDTQRSFFFSGVTAGGALHPQLLSFQAWDALLVGLAAGEDEDTLYVVPQGVGRNDKMTIATLRTTPGGTANVTYVRKQWHARTSPLFNCITDTYRFAGDPGCRARF